MYCMLDLALNNIEGEDLSTFGQHNWASLRDLDIRILLYEVEGNNLGPVGCHYLSRAQMGGIYEINLCTFCLKSRVE